jgi:hypothetical protein
VCIFGEEYEKEAWNVFFLLDREEACRNQSINQSINQSGTLPGLESAIATLIIYPDILLHFAVLMPRFKDINSCINKPEIIG